MTHLGNCSFCIHLMIPTAFVLSKAREILSIKNQVVIKVYCVGYFRGNNQSSVGIHDMLVVIYFANSILNPLVYAVRMQELRRASRNLVSQQSHADKRQQRRARRSQAETELLTLTMRTETPG